MRRSRSHQNPVNDDDLTVQMLHLEATMEGFSAPWVWPCLSCSWQCPLCFVLLGSYFMLRVSPRISDLLPKN